MPEKSNNGNVLGMIPGVVGGAIQIGQAMGIGRKAREKRQLDMQQKLQNQQVAGQKELGDHQNKLAMDMWNNTNYSAQVEHLKKAGLNPALLYGSGGGGGATVGMGMNTGVSGGQASTAVQEQMATQGATAGLGMLPAQIELIRAQTENVKADTASKGADPALKGAQTGEITSRTASIDFQNKLNNMIGADDMAERYRWASDKVALESQKTNAEYEQWKAANFGEMTFDDTNAPGAKAMRAGMDKALVDLKQAKLNNDATAAGNVVKQFEARLANEGIHPHSPWWTKLLTDMLQKAGIIDVAKQMLK